MEHDRSFKLAIMGESSRAFDITLFATRYHQPRLDLATVAGLNIMPPLPTKDNTMFELQLPSMTCGHCVGTVTKAIKQADPKATVEIDLPSHRVRIESTHSRADIEAAVKEAGYEPA